ncbi:restriction endonuclease subunit S [Reichenbachiella agariperforans]|uniref:restriction endonuclease subunit S n=1 Tax=Reichenbachiella agariperforans TaxID=156994 RepID=UPI001C09B10B|nr:restriction endonuclease subunit S [Reichenbachiella agariperforans]MBU2912706.1 restriction endonuclease subunit S [Reichenbachiella agariperforans]
MTEQMNIPTLRFPEFSGEWEKKKLGEITTKVGSGSTPKGGESIYEKNGIPFIRSQNVNGDRLVLDEVHISEEINNRMKGSIVKAKDVLLNITGGSIGRSCVVPNDFKAGNVNQHVCIIRLTNGYSSQIIQSLMASSKGQKLIHEGQTGSGREGLNFESIRLFNFKLPTHPEQEKIAGFLSLVDEKIGHLSRKKELLEAYKKGVMQEIFSQEIRFKADDGSAFEDWEEKKLGEVATFSKGKGISKNDIHENGRTQCIRYGELYTLYGESIKDIKSSTDVPVNELELSHGNDVIIPASGETQIDIATASCVLEKGIALGGDLNIVRGEFNGVWMSYYLNSAKKIDIAKLSQGISVVHLYSSQLKSLSIQLPPLPEQQKIADFLGAIDGKIAVVGDQLAKAKEWKKGLLQGMFV